MKVWFKNVDPLMQNQIQWCFYCLVVFSENYEVILIIVDALIGVVSCLLFL